MSAFGRAKAIMSAHELVSDRARSMVVGASRASWGLRGLHRETIGARSRALTAPPSSSVSVLWTMLKVIAYAAAGFIGIVGLYTVYQDISGRIANASHGAGWRGLLA